MDRFVVREGWLPAIMALLAGSAAAFVVFLAPAGALESAVGESGLPAVLASAEPPLGLTARTMLAGVAGLTLALAAFLGLSALEGLPAIRLPKVKLTKSKAPRGVAEPVSDAPRTRRPILATEELGAPLDSVCAEIAVVAPPPPAPVVIEPARPRDIEPAPPEIQSLAALVQRLEAGLQRRTIAAPTPVPPARPAQRVEPADMDEALRDAMATLRRMGARG